MDCTFGGGGHARLIADRIGPAGMLIGIDRDPIAEERFAELSAEVACDTRFIRADFVTALAQLREEDFKADMVYLDLGMSSMQVDTWARGFSYAYDAPLDMRMDPDQELTAREIVNTWDERRLARLLREYGEERYASQIARAIARDRRREELSSTQQLVDAIKAAIPARPSSPGVIRRAGPSRRCGSPSTMSWRSSMRRCRRRGSCCDPAAGWRRSRSTRSRIAASSGSWRPAREDASARRRSRSACAATSPRPSS